MLKLSAKRIIKSGLLNFFRNGFVSLSSVLVMTITLFIITSTLLLGGFLNYSLDQVKGKVDVNVYFVTSATENEILSVKKTLEAMPEVSSIEYISRDQALENFKEKHQGDTLTLQALDQLGGNPLGATLNIKAKDPSQYAGIANFLDDTTNGTLSPEGISIIDKVNYAQNKIVIDRLNTIIKSVNMIGVWLGIIFVLISIIITYNTIKLTIFMARDEISVMRLVGATSAYVKGPFIVEGLLSGIVSTIIVIILFSIMTFIVNHYYGSFFVGFNIFSFYIMNFLKIFVVILGSGIIVGSVSSYLAVHKFLKH